ncbi:hypothetical protein, partial [Methylobacterium sp. J-070]|uniref:hypothetical protein n=1 Tax=Methylobacterium sp. J-070 TaxID=2836650 RepID=UPI00391C982F|nr:hypothetical protein [Methylobacterium sp. J-070]
CRLHLDLAQLQHHLLRARLLTSPHVRLLRSWLILSISPVQSQPVRSNPTGCTSPREKRTKEEFMAYSITDGVKVYEGYRIAAYKASDIRLRAGCKLRKY